MGRKADTRDYNSNMDHPDLNKCPDCECFFAGERCPLCGKLCPEEMRAGRRKPPEIPKKKQTSSTNGRVIFIDWFHRWWFIVLMLFLFPLVGIILLVTSPHKKGIKIAVGVAAGVYLFLSSFGISNVVSFLAAQWEKPVNTSLSREEYMDTCGAISPEELYRGADVYTDTYVSFTVEVVQKITDVYAHYNGGKYTVYYVCQDPNNTQIRFLIRDCRRENSRNFLPGDVITVYGEAAGNLSINDMEYNTHTAPGVNGAYMELVQ